MNQKNITMGALAISVIALAVAGYSLNALTTPTSAKPATVLAYDVEIITFIQDNVSMSTDPTGNTFVAVGSIFPQGQIDRTASIGKYTCFGTFSNSVGDDVAVSILDITGVGQIIMNGLEPGPFNVTYSGAIVGGTGQYAGAQGTYAQVFSNSYTIGYVLTITSTEAS